MDSAHATATAAGQYAVGIGLTILAALVSGFALIHIAAAVPQAVFPIVAGPLLLAAAIMTIPVGRRVVRRRTTIHPTARTVSSLVGGAVVLCVCYLGVSVWIA